MTARHVADRPLRRYRTWYVDAALSFVTYLIPLAGAHWLWFLGGFVFSGTTARSAGSREWMLVQMAIAVLAQFLVFLLLRLTRRRSLPLRAFLVVAALVVLTPVLNLVLLVHLPSHYLIEQSTEPAKNLLTEICHVQNVDLLPGTSAVFAHEDETILPGWRADQSFVVIRIPGCRVEPVDVPSTAHVVAVTTNGSFLWSRRRMTSDAPSEWVLTVRMHTETPIPAGLVPIGIAPHLFADGRTLGWIERPSEEAIFVTFRNGDGVARRTLPPGSWDMARDHVGSGLVIEGGSGGGPTRWIVLDATGAAIRTIETPAEFSGGVPRLVPVPDGWVAWTSWVERQRYRLAWSLSGRVGRRELPLGLSFTSVAVDEAGTFIATSATSGLNIGSQPDEVTLWRTRDGAELFRRYAPKYSRATVALPTGRHFAVTELADGRSALRVYVLPTQTNAR